MIIIDWSNLQTSGPLNLPLVARCWGCGLPLMPRPYMSGLCEACQQRQDDLVVEPLWGPKTSSDTTTTIDPPSGGKENRT